MNFAYELKSIKAKLVRLLNVFQSIGQAPVPADQWYLCMYFILSFLN